MRACARGLRVYVLMHLKLKKICFITKDSFRILQEIGYCACVQRPRSSGNFVNGEGIVPLVSKEANIIPLF